MLPLRLPTTAFKATKESSFSKDSTPMTSMMYRMKRVRSKELVCSQIFRLTLRVLLSRALRRPNDGRFTRQADQNHSRERFRQQRGRHRRDVRRRGVVLGI